MTSRESPRSKPRERRSHQHRKPRGNNPSRRSRDHAPSSSQSSTAPLSADSLAKLNLLNEISPQEQVRRPRQPRESREGREPRERRERRERDPDREQRREREQEKDRERDREQERAHIRAKAQERERQREREYINESPVAVERSRRHRKDRSSRVVSGALLEEGNGKRLRSIKGDNSFEDRYEEKYMEKYEGIEKTRIRKKHIWIAAGVVALLLAIIIPVAVVVSNKKNSSSSGGSGPSSTSNNGNYGDVPMAAKGTYLDPATWADTTDFNTTYTNDTVGGLPVMGLFSAWNDSTQANNRVAALNQPWGSYATTPVRGVNLGGWLSLEPFITPSLFNYDSKLGIIDEWTLCSYLGPSSAASTLEQHYSTFVTEQTFIDIANAGLDHVRIPYSYWAVTTYNGDPYIFRTSWRYLLRGIEWARKHGLRINLDLHALPGSQNGWNHSGRQGAIGWLNGTDGDLNKQRSLDIHSQLSEFFAQERYQNILAFYGLANEPRMTALPAAAVVNWTSTAYDLVRRNGVTANVVFGDGFMGLAKWQGQLQGMTGLVLDVHQYEIFNVAQVVWNHTAKIQYACDGWTQQTEQSMNTATGFGPTLIAEWSQADTDCAQYLNDVNVGNRWTGTYNSGNPETQVLSPICPTKTNCDCTSANADPGTYSDSYKKWLLTFAEAQMSSFEKGWGWFYWTWKTESAPQWSYEAGLAAGILPAKAYAPSFNCSQPAPTYSDLSENY